ncbi:patatin-like phospholipase family protein [Desulfosarcina cetonica]
MIIVVLAGFQLSGCATPDRNALPDASAVSARIPGIDQAYIWGDQSGLRLDTHKSASLKKIEAMVANHGEMVLKKPLYYLALSGGGPNGAFGAGILNGWSLTGQRPVFTIVTGISTGAIIAPFAFLGSEYDATLREIYTRYRTEDALSFRSILGILIGESAADVTGMKHLLGKYIDKPLMKAIAREHNKGRLLFIGTTNLDAGRPVIWNIGRIAASGAPHALELIQDIILASASIPGIFPPVMIDYEAGGRRYQEMHVDGGVTRQVFLFPAALQWHKFIKELGFSGSQHLYILLNGNLVHQRKVIDRDIFSISARSIQTLIKNQGLGDLYKLFLIARNNDMAYHLEFIPSDFSEKPNEMFDLNYMQSLFDLGFAKGQQPDHWHVLPPGFAREDADGID